MSVTSPRNAPVQSGSRPKLTVTRLEVVFVMPPPLALIFSVNEPKAAFVAALSVRMEVPGGVSAAGEDCAVTPNGRGSTASATWEVNPFSGVIEIGIRGGAERENGSARRGQRRRGELRSHPERQGFHGQCHLGSESVQRSH